MFTFMFTDDMLILAEPGVPAGVPVYVSPRLHMAELGQIISDWDIHFFVSPKTDDQI